MNKFFVYGTLRPGEVRWEALKPYVTSIQSAYIYAQMYSTGTWPFIVIDDQPGLDSSRVIGELVTVNDEDVPDVLRMLDRIEGFSANDPQNSLFIRMLLPVYINDSATDAAYMYVGGASLKRRVDLMQHIPSGDWKRRDEQI